MIGFGAWTGGPMPRWKGWRAVFPDIEPFMEQARKQTSGYDSRDTRTMASMLARYAQERRIEAARRRYWRIQHSMWNCK